MMREQEGGSLKDCLLAYLSQQNIVVYEMKAIKPRLIKVSTNKGIFIAKQFVNQKRLLMQLEFLKKLRKAGFNGAYVFSDEIKPFGCKGKSIGFIEYLTKHPRSFTYENYSERLEGLTLLNKMHEASATIINDLTVEKHTFSQVSKWRERLGEFTSNRNMLNRVIPDSMLTEYLRMGEWALDKLGSYELEEVDEDPVIIHGDLAHHNFFRKDDGELLLIDFDLMAEAPPMIDYLQYANRLLIFNNCSLKEILTFPQFKKYRDNPFFLIGLSFPTDIYREWNRICRDQLWSSNRRLDSLWDITVEDLPKRIYFFRELKSKIGLL
ncbi:phosphotransferase [Bacillus sp. D386]|uniref:phosphotransferase n=1 Tax=Bacillus sp. D386 TaxID=2587155 RepID=UPI00111F41AC|nr:phosphotransferase [Bacillus sp. D386]